MSVFCSFQNSFFLLLSVLIWSFLWTESERFNGSQTERFQVTLPEWSSTTNSANCHFLFRSDISCWPHEPLPGPSYCVWNRYGERDHLSKPRLAFNTLTDLIVCLLTLLLPVDFTVTLTISIPPSLCLLFQISTWTLLTRVSLWIKQKACPMCRWREPSGTRSTLFHRAWRRRRLRSSAPSSPR